MSESIKYCYVVPEGSFDIQKKKVLNLTDEFIDTLWDLESNSTEYDWRHYFNGECEDKYFFTLVEAKDYVVKMIENEIDHLNNLMRNVKNLNEEFLNEESKKQCFIRDWLIKESEDVLH